MAAGIIYLDIDDEITSAAARIRGMEERRVAVVLPFGSRVATSRINFRLLSRDALTHEKRLSIVAGDAAARALAASAGLPVFATVDEYQESLEARSPARSAPTDRPTLGLDEAGAAAAGGAAAGGAALAAGGAALAGEVGALDGATAPAKRPRKTTRKRREDATEPATTTDAAPAAAAGAPAEPDETAAATAIAGAAAARSRRPDAESFDASAGPLAPSRRLDPRPPGGERPEPPEAHPPAYVRTSTLARPGLRIGRTPLMVGAAVVALAALVGGVGAYLILPSATAVLTPREETIGPLRVTIEASTAVSEPDAQAGVVPAEEIPVEVQASRSFEATGKRVEEKKATGTVRFSNLDPTGSNSIAKGSIVSTQGGVRFRTNAAVTVPPAELVGLQIFPASASVKVTAVEAGTDGNVEPNTIRVVPRGENPRFLDVNNPDATSGGSREEFPRVSEKDVENALAALAEELDAAFEERLADPGLAPGGATVFAETATLGEPVPSVDRASLVDQEVESFELGVSATGTVTVVDTAPLQTLAEQRLLSSVEVGHQLVEGSSEVTVEEAVVEEGSIRFPIIATAQQIPLLDPTKIEAAIRGRPLDEARDILADYGTAELTVWPDWVTSIPTIDARVEVTVRGPVAVETPGASDGPGTSGGSDASPGASGPP